MNEYTYIYIYIFFLCTTRQPQEIYALPSTPAPHWSDSYTRDSKRRGGRKAVHRSTKVNHKPREFLSLIQNSAGMLNITIRKNTFRVFLEMVVECMNKGKSTKFLNRRSNKTKPRTNTNARFLTLQVLSRELPQERADQVVE